MQVGHSPRLWGRQPLTHAFLQACLSVHPSVCHGNSRQTCHIHKLLLPAGQCVSALKSVCQALLLVTRLSTSDDQHALLWEL